VQLAQAVVPSWMGINFRQAPEKQRTELALAEGAAGVMNVYPDSPALAAGLETGDIVVGPPGSPFTEPHQIREWTMLARVNEPAQLEVVREGAWRRVTLTPKPFPRKWPELPGPPAKGTPAPPLLLGAYRGTPPTSVADGTPHLLFFWATWCAPCKLSVPELLAFEEMRATPVVAITDEPAEDLDRFFQKRSEPFPATVATDEYRRAFQAYAVSGTPTFVLIDAKGVVQSAWTGYTLAEGLKIDGWSWRTAAKRDGTP
jgi:thiol-disulfide isomerase/thioredoxin